MMIWFNRIMTMSTLTHSARTGIKMRRAAFGSEVKILCWSAGYGLAVATSTLLMVDNSVKRQRSEGDKNFDDSEQQILSMPL